MAEYITREAAMDIFGDVPMWQGYYEPYPWEVHCAIVGIVKLLKEEISKIPAADIDRPMKSQFKRMAAQMDYAPVVHGRWKLLRKGDWTSVFVCFVCGRREKIAESESYNSQLKMPREYPYCHCGARMDGGVENERD